LFDKPIPYDLISKIVKVKVKENLAKAAEKGKRSKEHWLPFAGLFALNNHHPR
jgi:hypothetical protein